MKNFIRVIAAAVVFVSVTSCGNSTQKNQHLSELNWTQSREGTKQYAYLESRDLEDHFYFGANVIETDGFISSALNFTIQPIEVKLSHDEENSELNVVDPEDVESKLLTFSTSRVDGQFEVDFASSKNDIEFNGLMQQVGGQFTVSDMNGRWISQGEPELVKLDQTNDMMLVDLKYNVYQVMIAYDDEGNAYLEEVLTTVPGDVTLRFYLIRKNSLGKAPELKLSVGEAFKNNIGYFGSEFRFDETAGELPIQRLDIFTKPEQEITFYLKDFPEKHLQSSIKAVESWNGAFGSNIIKVEVAPDHVDAGDPRYHVIKWFDGTDDSVGWAGVAHAYPDPETGLLLGSSVYIQGDTLDKLYSGIVDLTQDGSNAGLEATGKIGGIDFHREPGENPVIPFFTDPSEDFDAYMLGYYAEVMVHEVGHILGLRHNFAGANTLDDNDHSKSIMDYAPREFRNKQSQPGSYDIAAIKYGYFGLVPSAPLDFCTDDDLEILAYCNQGDFGDTVKYHIRGLADSANFLSQYTKPIANRSWISGIGGTLRNAEKLLRLSDQLTETDAEEAQAKLPTLIENLVNLEVHPSVDEEDKEAVEANIALLKKALAE